MLNFVHAESKRLKIVNSTRRRFCRHQYRWRKQENIHRLIILIKLIYTTIFISFTILTCFYQSIDDNIECSKENFIQIWDIWYSFLGLILILSLFIDRLKRQNLIPLEIINTINILLIISFITFVILGHIQGYHRLLWSSSIRLTHLTLLSIVFIDICPISIAIIITINSIKNHRSCRRIHAKTLISNV